MTRYEPIHVAGDPLQVEDGLPLDAFGQEILYRQLDIGREFIRNNCGWRSFSDSERAIFEMAEHYHMLQVLDLTSGNSVRFP